MSEAIPERKGAMQRDPTKIGGSDAPALCGKDPNKTAHQVALRITGEIQSDQLEGLDHIEFGNEMEGVLARFYERKEKVQVYTPVTVYHPKYTFMSANIDRLRRDRFDIGIEAKNTGLFTSSNEPTEQWGDPGTDEVPARVNIQCQHAMMIRPEIREFHVLRCYGGNVYQKFSVPRNEVLIDALIDIENDFMSDLRRGILPPPDFNHRTTKDVIKKRFAKIEGDIVAMPELAELTAAWEQACAERLEAEKREESLKNQIMYEVGNNGAALLADGRMWRRKQISKKGYEVKPTTYIECRLVKQ